MLDPPTLNKFRYSKILVKNSKISDQYLNETTKPRLSTGRQTMDSVKKKKYSFFHAAQYIVV